MTRAADFGGHTGSARGQLVSEPGVPYSDLHAGYREALTRRHARFSLRGRHTEADLALKQQVAEREAD